MVDGTVIVSTPMEIPVSSDEEELLRSLEEEEEELLVSQEEEMELLASGDEEELPELNGIEDLRQWLEDNVCVCTCGCYRCSSCENKTLL
jgi:hypothetical protein